MPHDVIIIRPMKLRLEKGGGVHRKGDRVTVPDNLYGAHPDWFRLVEDFEGLTVDELKERLRELELSTTGNKPELIERLRDA
jgi:hypothetical protein